MLMNGLTVINSIHNGILMRIMILLVQKSEKRLIQKIGFHKPLLPEQEQAVLLQEQEDT